MMVDLGALRGFLGSEEAKGAKEATISIASLVAIERELSDARVVLASVRIPERDSVDLPEPQA